MTREVQDQKYPALFPGLPLDARLHGRYVESPIFPEHLEGLARPARVRGDIAVRAPPVVGGEERLPRLQEVHD